MPSAPHPTPPKALPIQYTNFTLDHFKTQEGIDFFNQQMQQIVNGLNAGNGAAGMVEMPHGVDVRGAAVTGLGDPKQPSDAVSNAHVSTTYGYGAQRAQLDIGGEHALKGLTWAVGKIQQLQNAQPAQYDGTVNYININGLILQFGEVTTDINAGTLPVVFPIDFPNECKAVVPCTLSPTDRITYVVKGSVTTHGFTIANNGSNGFAYWIAVGY